MPIYEYKHKKKNKSCPEVVELLVKNSDVKITECPDCGEPLTKIMSGFSAGRNIFSESNLKDKGFSKFVPDCDGQMRKMV